MGNNYKINLDNQSTEPGLPDIKGIYFDTNDLSKTYYTVKIITDSETGFIAGTNIKGGQWIWIDKNGFVLPCDENREIKLTWWQKIKFWFWKLRYRIRKK